MENSEFDLRGLPYHNAAKNRTAGAAVPAVLFCLNTQNWIANSIEMAALAPSFASR